MANASSNLELSENAPHDGLVFDALGKILRHTLRTVIEEFTHFFDV